MRYARSDRGTRREPWTRLSLVVPSTTDSPVFQTYIAAVRHSTTLNGTQKLFLARLGRLSPVESARVSASANEPGVVINAARNDHLQEVRQRGAGIILGGKLSVRKRPWDILCLGPTVS